MNSLGELAAGVAHEINNPLGSIVQGGQNILRRLDPAMPKNIELAKKCQLDLEVMHKYMQESKILDFVHGIRDAGQRAANIVANLLQFARTSNAQKSLCNIHTIIENAIELASADYNIQKKTDFRHIKIIRDYSKNLPSIYCNAMEIEQVMLNILKNAAYALTMVSRAPVIHIKIYTEQDMLIIEIQDNGPGMKEEVKRKIFDPFFTTKPVSEGTGLGLSVSFNIIVEKHGGSFTVESTEAIGTKFIIVLPVISLTKENLKNYMQTVDFV
jgi:signal transduction histidine kinase